MSLATLYSSFDGRATRKQFWLGLVVLVVIGVAVAVACLVAAGGGDYQAARLVWFVVTITLLYPALAVCIKRLHDRGRPGHVVLYYLIPWFLHWGFNLSGITGDLTTLLTAVDLTFYAINLINTVLFVVDLGILRGTQGPNSYGPDPLQASTTSSPS